MPILTLDTFIAAPQGRCFDLARDVSVHCKTAAFTGERALPPGVTAGLLNLGDLVIFEARHLGVRQRLHARIVRMEAPSVFADEMIQGAFASLSHTHEFTPSGSGTLMRDTLVWRSPLGPLGRLADAIFLARHLRNFLATRNSALKVLAEAAV